MNPERHTFTPLKNRLLLLPLQCFLLWRVFFLPCRRESHLCSTISSALRKNPSSSLPSVEDVEPLVWVQWATFKEPIMTSCWALVCSWLMVIWHLCGWLICMTSGKMKASATRRSLLGPKVKTEERSWRRRGKESVLAVCVLLCSGNPERGHWTGVRKLYSLIMRPKGGFSETQLFSTRILRPIQPLTEVLSSFYNFSTSIVK